MNYWLLYIEFINHFKDIFYKGIPLSLLSQFPRYLNPEINNLINDINIKESLTVRLTNRMEVQSYFDLVINSITKSTSKKDKNGKIAINPFVLRLPEETCLQYFDPDRTIIISNENQEFSSSYTRYNLNKDPLITKDSKERIISRVKQRFNELNYHPIFNNKQFQEVFLNEIPEMVDSIEAIEKFFNENPIACILVGTTETMFQRTLTLVGLKYGIPSICLQHGNIVVEAGFMPAFAIKYFVQGEIEKQWYIDRGVKEYQIEITGHPRFDPIMTSTPIERKILIEKLDLNPKNNTILLITHPNQEKAFAEIVEKLVIRSDLNIIIKPHPTEVLFNTCSLYYSLSQKYSLVKVVTDQSLLYDIIPNSDLVILTTSTAGLEAMLFKKPILILDIFPNDYYKWKDILRPYIFTNTNQLAGYSYELINSKAEKQEFDLKRIEFLKMAYPQHLSGERVANLVNKLINEEE